MAERSKRKHDIVIDLPFDDDQRLDIASRLLQHVKDRTTDLDPDVMEIDPRIYTDPAVLATERRDLFGTIPIAAAHGSELPKVNDFVTVPLPNNEVVLVRQPDGTVQGFVNSCRHRGARLVNDESGSTRTFTCGYHGWSYHTNGSLRRVANANTFGEVDTSCRGLLQVPTEERHGCVWVVDRVGAPIDVAAWLGEMDPVLASYELDKYVCYRAGTFDEPINWKALMDAFVDGYHIAATHRSTVAPHFYSNIQLVERYGRHCRMISARRSIDKMRADPSDVRQLDRHITMGHFVMPNLSFLRQPDHFEMLEFVPHPTDPQRSFTTIRVLIRDGNQSEELAARWDKNWNILMEVLRDEDLVMNRHLQRAMSNSDVSTLLLGRNEVGNQIFHRFLRDYATTPTSDGGTP